MIRALPLLVALCAFAVFCAFAYKVDRQARELNELRPAIAEARCALLVFEDGSARWERDDNERQRCLARLRWREIEKTSP